MKVFSKFMIAFLALTLVFACKNTPEGDAAETGAAKDVATAAATAKNFNITDGTVYWTATKVGGQHSGTINASGGTIAVSGDNISSGNVNLDMGSIKVTDATPDDMKAKLTGHLSSPDFFDVASHPKGSFELVSVVPTSSGGEGITHKVTGNLTLKGITKSISLPASVIIAGDKLTAVSPKFTINRLAWDIKYNAGILGTAADKIIHDDISLNLELNAQAQ